MIVREKHKEEIAAGIVPSFSQNLQINGLAMRLRRTE